MWNRINVNNGMVQNLSIKICEGKELKCIDFEVRCLGRD